MFIGIDTSNYTTSVASSDGDDYKNIRMLLPVANGQRGLRQSDAVFQHIKQLPNLYHELTKQIDVTKVEAVGVSVRPRNIDGSYMPVFLAGQSFASVIADSMRVPLYEFSHQEGHIMAAIATLNNWELLDAPFLSVHLSGGTTEILYTTYVNGRFTQEIIGGTKDISAGQFIDRIGVCMGIDFPCGKVFDDLAQRTGDIIKLPVCTDGAYMNFSGVETKVSNLIKDNDMSVIARSVLHQIAVTLCKSLKYAVDKTQVKGILIAGGVASNTYIRQYLKKTMNANLYFAPPEYATDNAVGIAVLAGLGGTNVRN